MQASPNLQLSRVGVTDGISAITCRESRLLRILSIRTFSPEESGTKKIMREGIKGFNRLMITAKTCFSYLLPVPLILQLSSAPLSLSS